MCHTNACSLKTFYISLSSSCRLSVDNTVNFEQQASTAILDITGDEGQTIKRTKGLMKW